MIYWLKKLEWKIRKALGLQKKRIKTIDDIQGLDLKLFWKFATILLVLIIAVEVGEAIANLWSWFFPRIVRMPVIPV